jgi:hypothetical protein
MTRFAWLLCVFVMVQSIDASAAAEIEDVRTLDELRAITPLVTADGWSVRLGLSDGGEAAGPVMVLYCIAERIEPTVRSPATHAQEQDFDGQRIGPLYFDIDWGDVRIVRDRHRIKTMERIGPALSAATVPLTQTGKARLTVRAQRGEILAERLIVVRERPRPVWHAFARRERVNNTFGFVVADRAMPAVIRINGYTSRDLPDVSGSRDAVTKPSTRPSPLPFDVTSEPNAVHAMSLVLEGGAFVVKSSKVTFSNRDQDKLLARWWVNGAAVNSEVMPAQLAMQRTGQVQAADTVSVRFGLPDFLGDLRPGDRVALQLLHSPDGFDPAPSGIMQMQHQMMHAQTEHDQWPMLSNRIEFEITEAMLTEKDHADDGK